MAWNDPGNSGHRNPWGQGDRPPPDLDELLRRLQRRLGGLFGARRTGGAAGSRPPAGGAGLAGLALGGLALLWLSSGFYVVREGEQAVVLRFGRYQATSAPGLRWHVPAPVERVELVNMGVIRPAEVGYRGDPRGDNDQPAESLMLTADENIVDVKFAVQYRVRDAKAYLFNVRDPDATLHQLTESALREVVGKNRMEYILSGGRSAVAAAVGELVQKALDSYGTGLEITSVNMQNAQAPEQVQAAFSDAIQASSDQQRLINEAEAYRNEVLPRARGEAARILEEAAGYQQRVVAQATGEAARFAQVYAQYRLAPEVTRRRLYLDTMESVLAGNRKVIVDTPKGAGNSNLFYLPLDRLMRGAATADALPAAPDAAVAPLSGAPLVLDPVRPPRSADRRGREARP